VARTTSNDANVCLGDLGAPLPHQHSAKVTTAEYPKADVSIVACGPCHSATAGIPVGGGSKVIIFDEMTLKADISKSYTCIACHTSVIGREQPPVHTLFSDRTAMPENPAIGEE